MGGQRESSFNFERGSVCQGRKYAEGIQNGDLEVLVASNSAQATLPLDSQACCRAKAPCKKRNRPWRDLKLQFTLIDVDRIEPIVEYGQYDHEPCFSI